MDSVIDGYFYKKNPIIEDNRILSI